MNTTEHYEDWSSAGDTMDGKVSTACSDGFLCEGSANNSMPTDGVTGDLCGVGHYCENGAEIPCPAGTYSPIEGLSECFPCPQGYYCS